MRLISTTEEEETGERTPRDGFHTVNKTGIDTSSLTAASATDTFIFFLLFVVVEAVSKAALAWGITPPIRSVADFGGVNEEFLIIHGVKPRLA